MKRSLFFLLCLCVLPVLSQENRFRKTLGKLQAYLDSSAVRKVDTNYIEVPQKPWRIAIREKSDEFNLSMKAELDEKFASEKGYIGVGNQDGDRFSWKMRFNPPIAQAIGFFAGYRGLGIGYSFNLRKKMGRTFSFSSSGTHYGLNFRYRRFSTNSVDVDAIIKENEKLDEIHSSGETPEPVRVRSIILDGYYLFNGKRFSQAAAYSQSVIQKRSAGSLMLGAMFHHSSVDMAKDRNVMFIQLYDDIGKFSIQQIHLGVGYGYNWVPTRGLLVNAMAMPTISVFSKVKTHKYDSNYSIFAEIKDDGHKPIPYDDPSWLDDVKIWKTGIDTKYGNVHFNIDARASITYSWNRYFMNVFGQVNQFKYGFSISDVRLIDWYVRGSFGVRF